jgi:hypothetical protein
MRKLIIAISVLFFVCCEQKINNSIIQSSADTSIIKHLDSAEKIKGIIHWNRKSISKNIILPPKIIANIEKNYEALDTIKGDINNDKIDDLLVITSIKNESSLEFSESKIFKRGLHLFLGQSDGSFEFLLSNKNAIPYIGLCGQGDSFGGASIQNGEISIIEYCASSCKSLAKYNFKFEQKDSNLFLDNIIHESFCFDYKDYSSDTITMKISDRIKINKFDISKYQ